jgi:hypothetical protein
MGVGVSITRIGIELVPFTIEAVKSEVVREGLMSAVDLQILAWTLLPSHR